MKFKSPILAGSLALGLATAIFAMEMPTASGSGGTVAKNRYVGAN